MINPEQMSLSAHAHIQKYKKVLEEDDLTAVLRGCLESINDRIECPEKASELVG